MNELTKKSLFWGSITGLLLLALYFIILTLANSFAHALDQFQVFYPWLLLLALGFGIQVGLYVYIQQKIKQKKALGGAKKEIAGSAGLSAASMIACCAHHLVDVLPILGLSALFLFLAKYQLFFIVLGIASNVIGIIFMLEIIKKHSLFEKESLLNQILSFDLAKIKNWVFAITSAALLVVFAAIKNQSAVLKPEASAKPAAQEYQPNHVETNNTKLASKINDEGGLSIEVKPVNYSFQEPLRFEVFLNTHQGNLDFNLTKKSILIDDKNNQYKALEWQGKTGGHHLSGVLIFPALKPETEKMTLKIFDIYGIKERIFQWNLN